MFYPEIWPEIRSLLANPNLPPYELFITQVEEHGQVRAEAEALCRKVHVLTVENRGYDIWPFLYVLKQVDLDAYSYCIKLHTKRNMTHPSLAGETFHMPYSLKGALWRQYLFSVMQPQNIQKTLEAFEDSPRLGMVADFRVILRRDKSDAVAYKECLEFIRSQGEKPRCFSFVAGAMFVCRAALLKPMRALPFTAKDFDVPTEEHPRTLAHILERYMGWIIVAQGYNLKDVFTSFPTWRMGLRRIYAGVKRFLYQDKITRKGKRLIKICTIPVYSAKIRR